MAMKTQHQGVTELGFTFERGGSHIARTMMLSDLQGLLSYVESPDAGKPEFVRAILKDNCLSKRSGRNRKITARHLTSLYGLDPTLLLFRSLRYFWQRDVEGQPLIAILSAYARDSVLRMSTPYLMSFSPGEAIYRPDLEVFIDELEPGRFSKATLKSVAQNICSTWTQSGHVQGRVKKTRKQANATPGSVAYALLLGYVVGARGDYLFTSEYAKLLDCSRDRIRELAEIASQRGWIVFKQAGDVIEVLFPSLINTQEMEWLREQD